MAVERRFRFLRWGFVYTVRDGFCPLFLLLLVFDRRGVTFPYKQEEVTWLWPWVRKSNVVWYDPSVGGFESLGALNKFWSDYRSYRNAKMEREEAEEDS